MNKFAVIYLGIPVAVDLKYQDNEYCQVLMYHQLLKQLQITVHHLFQLAELLRDRKHQLP
ncbi:MAG: hypothetical protein AAF298_07600 [Cyanobacteria bacterium P01_A01_bin.40]